VNGVARFDKLPEVQAGGVELVPVEVHQPKEEVRPPLKRRQPAARRLFQHHPGHLPGLLQLAGLQGVVASGKQEA
jgi:hypothetical protein